MKKLVLLITLFLTNFPITAQDASNDATWEETVEFIKENIQYIEGIWLNDRGKKISTDIKNDIIYLKSSTEKFYSDGTEEYTTVEAPLKKISDAGFNDKNMRLSVFYTDKYALLYFNSHNHTSKQAITNFTFDKDLAPRFLKAFQHIAYLNKERRKKSKF